MTVFFNEVIDYAAIQKRLGRLYTGAIDGQPGKLTFAGIFAYAMDIPSVTANCLELGSSAVIAFPKYGANTGQRIAFAVAEGAHETGNYTVFSENLNYSAKSLLEHWPHRFNGEADADAIAKAGPEAIANRIYARPEFGNVNPGDGWKYRGRGINMQTFECNYAAAKEHTGVDFVAHPELMAQPGPSLTVACYYWQARGCWNFADRNDPTGWRHLTNGGTIGLDDFTKRTKRVMPLFVGAGDIFS